MFSLNSRGLKTGGHLFQLFGRDPNGTILRNAGTCEESCEQVALVSFGIGQESSGVD